jgi:KDO2-lipid IV(A) lauroyltransferase
MTALRDRIELALARMLAVAFALLPFRLGAVAGQVLALLLFDVVRLRRRVTVENLRNAFPQLSPREVVSLARRTYRNFGITLAEFAKLPQLSCEDIRRRVQLVHAEILEAAHQRGRGAIVVSGHFGNWEWVAAGIRAHGYVLKPIAASQRNPLVDRLIDEARSTAGLEVIKAGTASVRQILQTLRNNGFVGILFDQDAGRNGEFVRFFGRPVSTHRGPAMFHLKTGAPLILALPERIAPGRHKVHLERFDFTNLPGTEEERIHYVTQTLTSRLEETIRRQPDHWFWMHRRWKSSHHAPAHWEQACHGA